MASRRRKTMKTTFWKLSVAVFAALILGACSKSGVDGGGGGAPTTPSSGSWDSMNWDQANWS
jgi:hypothetical protein